MNDSQVLEALTGVFRELFKDETLELSESLASKDVANWDSLTNIILFVEIEKIFSIRFDTKEIAELANVGELIRAIQSKL